MNYLDLFHGIGGFALGAYWAGMKFENHYCSDIEKFAVDLYKKRFPESIQLGDITKINTNNLPKGDWIISGGFPCQDISIAGKGKGMVDNDGNKTRSGLWFDYCRIISELRPKFAIMENVGALTIRGLDVVLGSLAEIGYNAEWQDIRAEDMGAPHKRERIWIMAYSASDRRSGKRKGAQIKNGREKKSEFAWELPGGFKGRGFKMAHPGRKLWNEGDTTEMGEDKTKRTSSQLHNQSSSEGQRGNWAVEPSVGRLVNGLPNRVVRLKGLGNSIVPEIAELLFNRIKDLL